MRRRVGQGPRAGVGLVLWAALVLAPPSLAEKLCAYRTESGALVYTNTPTNDGVCGTVQTAPPVAAPSADTVGRYDPIVRSMAARYGVSTRLVHAVISTESAYNPGAISAKGARGLMQLMPETAKRYGVHDALDATENIRAGVAHLRDLLDDFGGDTRLAVAAYNAGQKAVEKYSGVPPFSETREYVKRVMEKLGARKGLVREAGGGGPRSPVKLIQDSSGNILLAN